MFSSTVKLGTNATSNSLLLFSLGSGLSFPVRINDEDRDDLLQRPNFNWNQAPPSDRNNYSFPPLPTVRVENEQNLI